MANNKNKKDIVIESEDQEIIIPAYKQKTMVDHVIILLGVIFAIIFLTVAFDFLFERSLLGVIFKHDSYDQIRYSDTHYTTSAVSDICNTDDHRIIFNTDRFLILSGDEKDNTYSIDESIKFILYNVIANSDYAEYGIYRESHKIVGKNRIDFTVEFNDLSSPVEFSVRNITSDEPAYKDVFNMTYWPVPFMATLIFIGCIVVLVWLVVHYIIDYIEVARALFNTMRNIKNAANDDIDDIFDYTSPLKKKTITAKKKDVKRNKDSSVIVERKTRQENNESDDEPKRVSSIDEYSDEEIDRLLMKNNYEQSSQQERRKAGSVNTKSLFDDDDK